MSKKHIVSISSYHFAFDSIKAATDCLIALNKAIICERNYDSGEISYAPEQVKYRPTIELTLNQDFGNKEKTYLKAEKPLALPKPKRGTILCICEKSSVAPGQTCVHCGRTFSESHLRTHGATSKQSKLHLD